MKMEKWIGHSTYFGELLDMGGTKVINYTMITVDGQKLVHLCTPKIDKADIWGYILNKQIFIFIINNT